jgi:hypothetical protein
MDLSHPRSDHDAEKNEGGNRGFFMGGPMDQAIGFLLARVPFSGFRG